MVRNRTRQQKMENKLKISEKRLEMVPFMSTITDDPADERKKTSKLLTDALVTTQTKIDQLDDQ